MAKIYSVDSPFDLVNLALGNPVTKPGGYFMKFVAEKGAPLYFQSPECRIKQGPIKSGKKLFFDLVFSNETDDVFLSWLESLEENARRILFQNRDKWFETPLDEHDIESSMMSPYKSYKTGKQFIVRSGVPMTLDQCDLKIYDESERETDISTMVDGTNCLVIFEFRGIRCSVRSFQFEIELKQMLVVKPSNPFDRCIVRASSAPDKVVVKSTLPTSTLPTSTLMKTREIDGDHDPTYEHGYEPGLPNLGKLAETEGPDITPDLKPDLKLDLGPELELDLGKLTEEVLEIIPEESSDNIRLKPKNDIYYKMYRDARAKAKEAKMAALQNYLEAKRIKNTYFLEEMSESDDDFESSSSAN